MSRNSNSTKSGESKVWKIEGDHEIRLEVGAEKEVTIKMTSGQAELFGSELSMNKEYTFTDAKFAIFTWSGCELLVTGTPLVIYKANETPMVSYINLHGALEVERKKAKADSVSRTIQGPRCMIVGPGDSGKSTLTKILINYAVRSGWKPTMVDVDVGQNSISIPGTIAATPIEHTTGVEGKNLLEFKGPLAYFFGHTTPSKGLELYQKLVGKLADSVNRRCGKNDEARAAGVIVNTCGWVDGKGYDLLIQAATAFKITNILVLGHERLFSQLKGEEGLKGVSISKLSKSGGVVDRDTTYRRSSRMKAIKHYFYGGQNELCPHQKVIGFNEVNIFRVGGASQAPSTALPIGAERLIDPNQTEKITPSSDLVHSILAVSYAANSDRLTDTNVAGYLYVTKVDTHSQRITVLSPSAGPLPQNLLLTGSLKWFE